MPQVRVRNRNAIGGANAEPVTLAEAKEQLRVTDSNSDDLINRLIIAATDYTENVLSRSIIEKTIDLYLDAFPPADNVPIEIPMPPLISITSIKYYDNSDVEQTWSSALYTVDTDQSYKGRVYPAINQSWPSTRNYPKAVHVEYQAGYADSGDSPVDEADNVPDEIKHAILLLIGHLFENREATTVGVEVKSVPLGYDALLANYKIRQF